MVEQTGFDVVVVGADGSWQSLKAVEVATKQAARSHSHLLVLTIVSNEGRPMSLSDQRRFEEDALTSAWAIAERAAMVAAKVDPTVTVEVEVLTSLELPTFVSAIKRVALLVLGEHGVDGHVAFSMGSTSGELVRSFAVPVLVPRLPAVRIHSEVARPAEVHVGLSLVRQEAALLCVAANEAAAKGLSLRVIHAMSATRPPQPVLRAQEQTWRAVHSRPECADIPVLVDVVQGEPATALVDGCGPDDLLIVGTRGGGTLAGLVPGSVARSVLDRSHCDVMVVPPGVEPTTRPAPHAVARSRTHHMPGWRMR